jgi:5-(carboxyamino)imidazole ribonucleotide synthase
MTIVGVLGGGQLGRMLALAGHPLGVRLVVLDDTPDPPAAEVAERVRGDLRDRACLEAFARRCEVVTYETESLPVEAVRFLAEQRPVFPPPEALAIGQDRLLEKRLFQDLGISTAPFAAVDSVKDLRAALHEIGLPAILKTRRGGYDGRGQVRIHTIDQAEAAWARLDGHPAIVEGFVDFTRELSVIAVRGRDGATRVYPLAENTHDEGILRTSVAPADGVSPELTAAIGQMATRVLDRLGYVGVLAIELFERDGHVSANELAPRVHNSGHWTIEGAETSQFENHLRAILGWPLGSTDPVGLSAMVNLIGTVPEPAAMLAVPGTHVHLYSKQPAPQRKLGHVTIRAATADARDAGLAHVSRLVAAPPPTATRRSHG